MPICAETFRGYGILREHLRLEHGDEKSMLVESRARSLKSNDSWVEGENNDDVEDLRGEMSTELYSRNGKEDGIENECIDESEEENKSWIYENNEIEIEDDLNEVVEEKRNDEKFNGSDEDTDRVIVQKKNVLKWKGDCFGDGTLVDLD